MILGRLINVAHQHVGQFSEVENVALALCLELVLTRDCGIQACSR